MILTKNQLYLACGEVDITPQMALPLIGYRREIAFDRVASPLLANVQIWYDDDTDDRNIVQIILSIDTLFVDAEFENLLARACGLGTDKFLTIASHTHNAPALFGCCAPNMQFSSAYRDYVIQQIANMVRNAAQPLKVTAVKRGSVTHTLTVNRRKSGLHFNPRARKIERGVYFGHNRQGDRQNSMQFVSFLHGDEVLSTIWNFAAHPAFYHDQQAVSADYPGAVREAIKGELGTLLFFPGFSGSAIPRTSLYNKPRNLKGYLSFLYPFVPNLGSFTSSQFQQYAHSVAQLLLETARRGNIAPVENASVAQEMGSMQLIERAESEVLDVIVKSVAICGARFVGASGEIPAEWERILNLPDDVVASGYAAGRPTYVPTEMMIEQGGYESQRFWDYFMIDGKYVDDIDQRFKGVIDLIFRR